MHLKLNFILHGIPFLPLHMMQHNVEKQISCTIVRTRIGANSQSFNILIINHLFIALCTIGTHGAVIKLSYANSGNWVGQISQIISF